ncbi:hypothetical protein Tco_1509500 [Tanacetum coccineum]
MMLDDINRLDNGDLMLSEAENGRLMGFESANFEQKVCHVFRAGKFENGQLSTFESVLAFRRNTKVVRNVVLLYREIMYRVDGGDFVENYDCLDRMIMPPRMRTRSAGRPAAESQKGGTGKWVGKGRRGRGPKGGNDERINELNGQGNDQGLGANRGIEGVNGNVEGVNGGVGGAPDFSTIIA